MNIAISDISFMIFTLCFLLKSEGDQIFHVQKKDFFPAH